MPSAPVFVKKSGQRTARMSMWHLDIRLCATRAKGRHGTTRRGEARRLLAPAGTIRFAPVPRENLVRRTLSGYTLESEVGEGGTAAVFRAKHDQHGHVAVKVLREKLRNDRTA